MKTSSYNLITPMKNEEDNLIELAQCVIDQKLLPNAWVIIDDGSTDRTPEILKNLTTKYDWIHSVRLDDHKERTFGKHFSRVLRRGFEETLKLSKSVKYLAKIDADARFHDESFEKMIRYMDKHPNLAIASPKLMTLKKKVDVSLLKNPKQLLKDENLVIYSSENRVNEPFDEIRVYRKTFLDNIGGFPVTDASSDVIHAKAIMRGYEVDHIDEVWGYLVRETNTTLENMYEMGKFHGYRSYIQHYHPVMLMAKILFYISSKPMYGIGHIPGYFQAFINQEERINDPEIIEYFKRERFKKVFEFVSEV